MATLTRFRWLLILMICCGYLPDALAQEEPPKKKRKTQTVRGRILDKYSKQPIIGALVSVDGIFPILSTFSNDNGTFILERVPVGRQTLLVEYAEYAKLEERNVIVTSGKEAYIELEIIKSNESAVNRPINDMLQVSARSFSVEETQRFPASFNDPNRMALSFAGVRPLRDADSDMLIRGNTSMMSLWRLDGLDIPNPNHFANLSTMGGGLTVFSASLLNNADFSSSAWSADYGNSVTSTFDLHFRKGNQFKREHTLQAGLIGLNFSTEGPFKKERSSYLVNYRYSTLGILSAMGLYLVRDNVSNNFQDVSFNLSFASKDNRSTINIFGVGGISNENWFVRKDTSKWLNELDYTRNKNGSNLGILGVNFTRTLDNKSYLRIVAGATYSYMYFNRNILVNDSLQLFTPVDSQQYTTIQTSIAATYHRKISDKLLFKTGVIVKDMQYSMQYGFAANDSTYINLLRKTSNSMLLQGYIQTSYRPIKQLTINAGVHSLFFTLNNTYSIEPRLSIRYQIVRGTSLGLAYGLHGSILPLGAYWVQKINSLDGSISYPNHNLKMTKAHHFVASFLQSLGDNTYIQLEGYYQQLYNVPVSLDSNSTAWYFQNRNEQATEAYTSQGLGRNYGATLTIEKKFSRGYYAIGAANLLWSQYKTLQNVWRSTQADSRLFFTLTGGKEFVLPNFGILQLGARVFVGDPIRYTPVDTAASIAADKLVLDYAHANEAKPNLFFRTDIRLAYRQNGRKAGFIVSLDIQNVTNFQNQRDLIYDRRTNSFYKRYHSGILPVISFQVDF